MAKKTLLEKAKEQENEDWQEEAMIEAEADAQDDAEAELAFELRAAFGPGEEVVNILTGKKWRT